MRHRGVKGKEDVFSAGQAFMIKDPAEYKGRWKELFCSDAPIELEIGSGKGQFICSLAKLHPERNYIACECLPDVYVRILEKIIAGGITNIRLICGWMDDPALCFAPGEISGIYLNFSDPWPKARHEKRRLTCKNKLMQYRKIAAPGSLLRFKTDNDDLFEFSLGELCACDMETLELSRDLHNSPYNEGNIMTEYEEKFSGKGKNINYVAARL